MGPQFMDLDTTAVAVSDADALLHLDDAYEFCAPRFFDFLNEPTEDDDRLAELWLETSLSDAPSPFMPRIKLERSVQIDSFCDFGAQKQQELPVESSYGIGGGPLAMAGCTGCSISGGAQEVKDRNMSFKFELIGGGFQVAKVKPCNDSTYTQLEKSSLVGSSTFAASIDNRDKEFTFPVLHSDNLAATNGNYTPNVRMISVKGAVPNSLRKQASEARTPKAVKVIGAPDSTTKNQTAMRTGGPLRKPSDVKLKRQAPVIRSRNNSRCPGNNVADNSMATDIAQENQAIKKQKLDGGRDRQILNVKIGDLSHKSRLGLTGGGTHLFTSADNVFQAGTASVKQKLTLTRPKEFELETSHRVRAVRVKSSAELEEEMLAKIPKFKARPLNKKILEAPSLPALPRTAPQPPEFQEFHLKTMERASQRSETSSLSSTKDSSSQNQGKPLKLTEPHSPHLETALRARHQKIKSSQELELEELQKFPKFKARPFSKKILDSKGDVGLFCNPKPQLTTPQEFHFATYDRLGPPVTVSELFDKLSLHPDLQQQDIPRITTPNPFHLHTEDRGIEKQTKFAEQNLQKQLDEERVRILKANSYPYTTTYPVIPPKPKPKKYTKPEAFQLECLVRLRHEEEVQRMLDEKQRIENEEPRRRSFKAHPNMRDSNPLPLPQRERKPLTEVQEFVLHAEHQAANTLEFHKKVRIKEDESTFKRSREECERAKMIEEKAVKKMRRTAVTHARPLS